MDLSSISHLFSRLLGQIQSIVSHILAQPDAAALILALLGTALQLLLPLLAILVVVRCARSLLQGRVEPEGWGWLTDANGDSQILRHWEVLLGRSRGCDIVISDPTVSRNHAVLTRDDRGSWILHPLRSKNGVFLNRKLVVQDTPLKPADTIGLGGVQLTFRPLTQEEEAQQARTRTRPGKVFSPGVTLILLTLFQAALCLRLLSVCEGEHRSAISLSFLVLAAVMWGVYTIYRVLRRTGFEIETLAFFLTSLCLTVTAISTPDTLYKQLATVLIGIFLFFALSILLRDLDLAKKLRWPAAIGAAGLFALNLLLAAVHFGAKNWLSLGPISFQPSELVKVAFILVGATTLDRMFARRNLIFTLVFSAYCVGCLALMSDFGTALIFFVAFLAIAFLRSGDLPSVAFMTAAAVFACVIVLNFRPYIARRFSIYGHVWEDPAGLGYQQTRTLSAAASGGLFGQGIGNGWLHNIGAANTDLVFGVVCEEMGLIIAVLAVSVIVLLGLFAVKSAATGRSTFYVIAALSTAMIFLVQTSLNVFGSTDLLPLTGVTFPFVSCGGSSMMSCWCLLAYIKAADTRQNAGLAIRLPKRTRGKHAAPAENPIPDIPEQPFRAAPPSVGRTRLEKPQKADPARTRSHVWEDVPFTAELTIRRDDDPDYPDWIPDRKEANP